MEKILLCPEIHNLLSAVVVGAIDFDLYMTGSGTALSKTSYPDVGLVTMPDLIENANNVQERVDMPLIVACDNGYGGGANVIRAVRE